MLKRNKTTRFLAVLLAGFSLLGFLVYSGVVMRGVFLFDDFEYVVGNRIIQDLSYFRDMNDPRVIGYLTFALNYAVHGEAPRGYHWVNLAIHIANSVGVCCLLWLLYGLLGRSGDRYEGISEMDGFGRREAVALLSGLVFLVHPVGTQAVSYITQRFTSLSAFLYLAATVSYLWSRIQHESEQGSAWGAYILSVAGTVLAMKTKEISFTIPLMLGVFEALVFRGSKYGRKRYLFLIPHAAALVIIPLSLWGPEWGLLKAGTGVDEITRKDKLYDLYERSAYEYFTTQIRVVVTYLRLLVLPVNQLVVYDYPAAKSMAEFRIIMSGFLHAGVFAAAFYAWRKGGRETSEERADWRLVSMGIIWFYLTLSVESSIIPIKDIIFEHRTYLPGVGIFGGGMVLAIKGWSKLGGRWGEPARTAAVAAVIVAPLALGAYERNKIWTDEVLFWDDVVRKTGKAIGYNNRGNAYGKIGLWELALEDLSRTIDMFENSEDGMAWENADFTPTNRSKTYMNRAEIYQALGQREKAEKDLERAKRVMVMPLDVKKTLKLADAYMKSGAYVHAIEEYNKILDWDPENVDALNDRGNAFSWTKLYNEAVRDLSKAIELKPDFVLAYHNRGIAFAWAGKKAEALADFRKACEMGFNASCEGIEIVKREGGTVK